MGSYEQHYFKDETLPVLFHLDRVAPKEHVFPHWHENIELLFCIDGEGEVVIDSRPVPLKAGGLTVVNSSRLHYTRAITGEVVYYCLIVDSRLLERFDLFVEEREFAEYVEEEEVKRRFGRIIEEMESRELCYEAMVKGEIAGLMAYLIRRCSSPGREEGKSGMVKAGLQYLKKHYREPLSLEAVAEAAGFSRYYFCRGFKRMTGYTVNEYLRLLRCQEAARLLREEGKTVSEAAADCGFDDVSYFTKSFKRQTGQLPSQMRKEKKLDS